MHVHGWIHPQVAGRTDIKELHLNMIITVAAIPVIEELYYSSCTGKMRP